jgi:hypothetical protein
MGRQLVRGGLRSVVIVLLAVMLAAVAGAAMAATAGAAPITEFNLPMSASATSLIDGPDGALYFAEERWQLCTRQTRSRFR